MTTATPVGGTTFFSLNVTTREQDFLYKSKVNLATRGGMAGRGSRSAPGVEVKSGGSGGGPPGLSLSSTICPICPLRDPEHRTSLFHVSFFVAKIGILLKLPHKVGGKTKQYNPCQEPRIVSMHTKYLMGIIVIIAALTVLIIGEFGGLEGNGHLTLM